jgi:hypothetical protein
LQQYRRIKIEVSERTCTSCNETKSLQDYYFESNKKGGKRPRAICKLCHSEYNKNWEKNNKDKAAAKTKRYRHKYPEKTRAVALKRYFDMTLEELNQIEKEQNTSCMICKIHQDDLGESLCVDHDHETKDVRGILCRRCNLALGQFRDNVELLENAVKYLKKYGKGYFNLKGEKND